jgi:UDP-N-acetylglucosamine--N-acetylmuramyl-(pentapeptide) pyrophosphoryl-undecaprenol N-acetylglucosamine transferase
MLAGGGTGGHLFPALAIADEIRKIEPTTDFLFVGTQGKMEARIFPEHGYPFRTIWISGFHRRLTVENLLVPLKVVVSLVQSFFLIRNWKPDVVVGTGGYVCGPLLYVSTLLRIPTVIHESNSYPGVTTRLLAKRVQRLFIAFEEARRHLGGLNNIELVGTPTRAALRTVTRDEGARTFGLDPRKKTLLVFGGSLGATSINNALLLAIDELTKENIQVIWQTGERDFQRIRQSVGNRPNIWVGSFIDKMECAFAAADLAVCRAGATTLAELTLVGLPAILVPYPYAAANHQEHNAWSLAYAGAAVVVRDHKATDQLFKTVLTLLKDEARLRSMSEKSRSLGKPDAGAELAKRILELVR